MSTDETKIDKSKKTTEKRLGFDDKGKPYPGVDAKTGERVTVTLDALKSEFGIKEGIEKYMAIASLEAELIHPESGEAYTAPYFFNPRVEGAGYRPDLTIATLPADARKRIAEIINTQQVKET